MGLELDNQAPRYVVGIDLGTTNSAVAFVDTAAKTWLVVDLATPQLVAPGQVEARETLPSFLYEATEAEAAGGALRMPWDADAPRFVVGAFARDQGAAVPGRLVVSAKSWLSHGGVDRTAALLPWHGAADVERVSPVEASRRYLAHIRAAWDNRFPSYPLAEQDVVLTVPASFDEVARELTVEAATSAGIARVVLLEEPQAAFYAWINAQGERWEKQVEAGQTILVCDIGGGTSDFTLIRVRRGDAGKIIFHRVAVGEHLILGGDNLDLALAHHVEQKLNEQGRAKLDPRQWGQLVRSCRVVKETLLGQDPGERAVINISAGGSRLIGGAIQIDVSRDEVEKLLVDGFLPNAEIDDRPLSRRSGFQEFGLPYAPDAAITRYLAAFLRAHGREGEHAARPDLILFNGGLFESPVLRARLLEVLGGWFQGEAWTPVVLDNDRLDLAVSRGAAYYGMVRRGFGVRISGGLAHSYYIGVEEAGHGQERKAICLLPAGVEEGQDVDLSGRRFDLLIRQPVEFPLYVSSTRTVDKPGALLAVDPEQMTALPPIRTVLQSGRQTAADTVTVNLHARLTEIGTLDLWCAEAQGDRKWRLQFDVRSAVRSDVAEHEGAGEAEGVVDEGTVARCDALIRASFARNENGNTDRPEGLVKRLEEATAMSRHEWPSTLMRGFWKTLMDVVAGRRLGENHEARWLNLTGFSLRPGYGLAVDDWRVAQNWRLFGAKVIHARNELCRAEWWILWRRIAGGLSLGQQQTLAEPLLAAMRSKVKKPATSAKIGPHELAEMLRVLGALEHLKLPMKVEIGDLLVELLGRERIAAIREAAMWAIGRLGARVPVYGPLNAMIGVDVVEGWAGALMQTKDVGQGGGFSLVQMTRMTGDRYRDVSGATREAVLQWLEKNGGNEHFAQLILKGGRLREQEQRSVFGESLPRGLRID